LRDGSGGRLVSETELGQDPWAWLYEVEQSDNVDYSAFRVTAVVIDVGGDRASCLAALDSQETAVDQVIDELPTDFDGDWIWVLPDDVTPTATALSRLVQRVAAQPSAAVIGGLLIEPRRRGAGTMVRDWAQTISANGIVRPLTEPGELYQGQLTAGPALGVPASGMLIRGDVWRFLGGLNTQLPRSCWGLDFGWRANLAGYLVLTDPEVHLVDRSAADDPSVERAAGLALVAAHAPRGRRWLVRLRLALVSLTMALGYLLGKDPQRSAEELRGLFGWMGNRTLRRSLRDQLDRLPVKAGYRAVVRQLRPRTGAGLRRLSEAGTARFLEWLHTFTGRGSAASIDEMTGDDFAETSPTDHRIPLAITGALALVIAALAAVRGSYGYGSLVAPQLLAAPARWSDFLDDYLRPVAGTDQVSGAPWSALTGLFSLVAAGLPEWLVTAVMVGCVPLAWLFAFRLLRALLGDQRLAGIGALGYALSSRADRCAQRGRLRRGRIGGPAADRGLCRLALAGCAGLELAGCRGFRVLAGAVLLAGTRVVGRRPRDCPGQRLQCPETGRHRPVAARAGCTAAVAGRAVGCGTAGSPRPPAHRNRADPCPHRSA